MKYVVTINQKNYEVEVEQGQARLVKTTETAAAPVTAQVVTAAPAAPAPQAAAPAPAVQTAGGDAIKAPMPGMILQIVKNAGASVKEGETILILEAMKMENEIMAPRDGVIAQIVTAKGASVNTGDVLAVLQ